jgi:hypothetical protein
MESGSLGEQMGFVCNRLRAKLGSFGIFAPAGVEGQQTAAPNGTELASFRQ